MCFTGGFPLASNPDRREEEGRENLLVDLLQEGDLLLQRLDASLQVQTSQRGGVHILQQFGESLIKIGSITVNSELKMIIFEESAAFILKGQEMS